MEGQREPLDPGDLRISDADRHRVVEVLREAAGDGRIDFNELDERIEATWRAKTYRDLVPITVDLGAAPPPSRGPVAPTRSMLDGPLRSYQSSVAVMSECKRVGVWDLGSTHVASALMGSVVLDLRVARFADPEVVITANAVMGSVTLLVDARTVVHVEGVGIMGSFTEVRSRVAPAPDVDSPMIRVRGLALMGSVEIKRKGPPGAARRRLLKS